MKKGKRYRGHSEDMYSNKQWQQPSCCFKSVINVTTNFVTKERFSFPLFQSVPGPLLPTFDELRPVRLAQLLQEAVIEALCLLRGHCQMEVRLVALEDALEGKLTDTEHLILFVHHTLRPVLSTFILKHT